LCHSGIYTGSPSFTICVDLLQRNSGARPVQAAGTQTLSQINLEAKQDKKELQKGLGREIVELGKPVVQGHWTNCHLHITIKVLL